MIRLGMIGAGKNASANAAYFAADPRVRVTAVADPLLDRATAIAERHGARATDNYESMLGDVDAVAICSPNGLHAEQVVRCADAGLHIFCEKPVALHASDARRAADAVRRAGIRSMVGLSGRYTPRTRTLLQHARSGQLGEILGAWVRRHHYFKEDMHPRWRLDSRISGGVLCEILIHELDWIVQLLGAPQAVSGRIRSEKNECPESNDFLWATLAFPSGAVATIEGSIRSPANEYAIGVTGREGAIFSERNGHALTRTALGSTAEPLPVAGEEVNKTRLFADAILGECEATGDIPYGAYLAEISDCLIRSAMEGRTVDIPADPDQPKIDRIDPA